jgi:AraC-like DNA-binding protein
VRPPDMPPLAEWLRPRRTPVDGVMAVDASTARAFGRHTHETFGIGVMLGGAQDSASGRGPVWAERGQVITVNPGEVHDGVPVGGARLWRMLYFHPDVLARSFEAMELPAGSELAHPVLDRPAAARAVLGLHRAVTDPGTCPLALESRLLETVAYLTDRRACRANPAATVVARARRAIDADPHADWRLDDLAALCGISRFHFLRAFSAAAGLPPHAYLVQRRLQAARRMIADGHQLADVAAACGFSDQSHLHRHFVRSYGYTPGQLAAA